MSVFDAYAQYYDLLYKNKDYKDEVDYVLSHIDNHIDNPVSLLDLGCGTGRHDEGFADHGLEVVGVDQSPQMIEEARARTNSHTSTSFRKGDVRDVRIDRNFDVVTSLFHVVSYQQLNEDLSATFETVRHHLSERGVFIFDCWYGPTVLTERPEVRVKRLENDAIHVTRVAEPEMHPNKNLVDVNYSIFVKNKNNEKTKEVSETHTMRYLFSPELSSLLSKYGLEIKKQEEWMTGNDPGFDTWSVTFIAQTK